jgi:Bacterial Ig-like domain
VILRKLAAVVAVSTLALVFVVAGSTAAYAAPNPPTVDQTFPDPWITDSTQPQVQGNMDLGIAQIDVESSTDGVNYTPYCSVATNPLATVWFCNSPSASLPVGVNYIRATATDTLPETSAPGNVITIQVVNAPTITAPADNLTTNDYQPTFTGTSDGTYFDVYTSDFVTHFCGGTVVNSTWNCTPAFNVPDGDYTYLVETTFGATTIYSSTRTLHIDTVLNPLLTDINGPAGADDGFGKWIAATTAPNPTITGTAEPGATITMWQNYSQVGCQGGATVADIYGDWSCTLAAPLTASGIYVFGSQQTDSAGNTNLGPSPDEQLQLTYTDITPPAPPIVTSPIGTIAAGMNVVTTNSTGAIITGTGEPGASIDVVGNICMIVPTVVDSGGNWTCQLTTPMTPDANYDVFFGQTDAAFNSSSLASPGLRFAVDTTPPSTPTVSTPSGPSYSGVINATTQNTHPVITGSGENGATVHITVGTSTPLSCTQNPIIVSGGTFSCTVAWNLTPGVYYFGFSQTDTAGNSSGSAVTRLRLAVEAPPTLPTLGLSWFLSFSADTEAPAPGQNVTLTGSDLPPGATVNAELHSTPMNLGSAIVKDDGTFRLNTVIPNTAEPGDHHYVVTVTPITGEPQTSEVPVTVVAAPPPAISEPASQTDTTTAGGGSGSGLGTDAAPRDTPAAPNQLSHSLPTLQDIVANPVVLVSAAASSLALLFLVAFPAELLNSTLDQNYERVFGKLPKVRLLWWDRLRTRLRRTPVVGAVVLTSLVALILSFADPHFGFDLASLRLFLACAIGMFVLGYVANGVTAVIIRRRWSITSVIELQPFGLLVAGAGVLLSRVLDFSPGLLIGLILALSLSAKATAKEESRAVLVWAAVILALATVSWVGYSLFATDAPGTFVGALVDDSLVAIATEGVSGLIVGLLPLGFLDGRVVFSYSKLQWLGTYLVTLLAFFVIVVPSGALWGGIDGPFWVWLGVLVAFAALCVGVFLWFRNHPEAEDDDEDDEDGSVEASVTGSRQTKSLQR